MKVIFKFPDGSQLETEGYDQLNLLAHAQLLERSVQSRCGGHCECGTCRVAISGGRVSASRDAERELLARVGSVGNADPRIRLACQTYPEKDQVGAENVV